MNILNHTHSGLRWIALILLIWAISNAFTAKRFEKKHKMINLFAMVCLHIQLVIGLIQYFTSAKVQLDEKSIAPFLWHGTFGRYVIGHYFNNYWI
jgi:heme A synthase